MAHKLSLAIDSLDKKVQPLEASLTTLNWDTPTLNTTLMGEQSLPTLRALALAAIQSR